MKVAFHSHGLTMRGSEVALLDYALQNVAVLGNRSYLVIRERPGLEDHPVFRLWRAKLPCLKYRNPAELTTILRDEGIQVFYQIKPGTDDGLVVPGVRNCIHAMFAATEFHGDVYAYVSGWLSRVMTGRNDRFVPHLVPRATGSGNLRMRLGIPPGAKVFGRHGAADTFNLPFVHQAVWRHAREHPEDHFCFLNTDPFLPGNTKLRNVHFLPGTENLEEKTAFLNTCDAMLHARLHGETFGLAVGEFAVLGKPVITFAGSRERAHLEMLGQAARTYRDAGELASILQSPMSESGVQTGYHPFADPRHVMEIFQKVFLS